MPLFEPTQASFWAGRLPDGAVLHLVRTADPRSQALEAFAADLGAALPRLAVQRRRDEEAVWPWLEAGDTGVRLSLVPDGPKLDVLMGLLAGDDAARSLPAARQRRLEAVTAPAALSLYVAPGCPYCPRALAEWSSLAARCAPLRLAVLDAGLFPEAAREAGVAAVPTLRLDDAWRWSGDIPVDDVLELLGGRDPAALGAAALEGLIKDGRALDLGRLMAAHGRIFPAFVDLLTHAKWPVRLGAMVAAEELQERAPDLARRLAEDLRGRFDDLDAAAQGDALHVIGEVGGPEQLAFADRLAALHDTAPSELQEAARDAATRLRARHPGAKEPSPAEDEL